MKTPTMRHYKILMCIFRDQLTVPLFLSKDKISSKTGMEIETSFINEMCKDNFDPEYGAWLICRKNKYGLSGVLRNYDDSTGGYKVVKDALKNNSHNISTRAFREEALTGLTWDGERSKITNAALYNESKRGCGKLNAEQQFKRSNQKFIGRKFIDGYDNAEDLKKCARCGELKKRPPSDEWNKKNTYCKKCESARKKKRGK